MRVPRQRKDDLPASDPDFRFPLSEVPMPDLEWTTQAACRRPDLKGKELQAHVEAFFPTSNEAVEARLIEQCMSCPVRVECLAFATDWKVLGIWGGLRQEERKPRRIHRERMKGAA